MDAIIIHKFLLNLLIADQSSGNSIFFLFVSFYLMRPMSRWSHYLQIRSDVWTAPRRAVREQSQLINTFILRLRCEEKLQSQPLENWIIERNRKVVIWLYLFIYFKVDRQSHQHGTKWCGTDVSLLLQYLPDKQNLCNIFYVFVVKDTSN